MSLRHPILPHLGTLLIYMGGLALCAILLTFLACGGELASWRAALGLGVPLGLAAALLGLLAWWVYGKVPMTMPSLIRFTATHLALAGLCAYLLTLISRGLGRGFEALSEPLRGPEERWWLVGVFLYLTAALFHYLAHLHTTSKLAESRALSLRSRARDAKLQALKAQIDPHFLFNSLNSLSALCGFDPKEARRMTLLLAGFFRGSVEAGRRDDLPLGEEIELMKKYLEIEKVRFTDRLEVEIKAEEQALRQEIPTFLLQPLIENAVKHGIAALPEGGTIHLDARLRAGRLEIAVSNPCDPDRPRTAGVGAGLANVRGRLLTLFGPEAQFDIEDTEERYRVNLAFPAREEIRRG